MDSPVWGPILQCEDVMVTPHDAYDALYMVKFDRPFDGQHLRLNGPTGGHGFILRELALPFAGDPATGYYLTPGFMDYDGGGLIMGRGSIPVGGSITPTAFASAPWLQYFEHQTGHLPLPPRHSPTMLFNTHADIHFPRNRGEEKSRGSSRVADDRNRNDWLANGRRFYNNRRSDSLNNLKDDASDEMGRLSNHSKVSKRGFASSPNRKNSSESKLSSTIYRHQTPSRGPSHELSDYDKRHSGSSNNNRGRNGRPFSCHTPRMINMYPQSSPHSIPPDRFVDHAHLVQVTKPHADFFKNDGPDQLSKSIWTMFMANQQTPDTYRRKVNLWRKLFLFIRNNFPKFGLFLVGSTMTGLGSESSDVDMCLLVRHSEMDQRNEAICHLGHIAYFLRQCDFVNSVQLIQAKVPILKFNGEGLEVDLNCNNSVGIRNTHLLFCYARMDWRVRPLVVVIKLWAAHHDINEAKHRTVSSYSWALMVIHFLQCGTTPPVLPCLQQIYRDHFSNNLEINQIEMHEELPDFKSENTQSLGELLIEFFKYYAYFDFSKDAISVRLGKKIPIEECRRVRSPKNDPNQWKYICIEEPFDQSNTARSVFEFCSFELIRETFVKSSQSLNESGKLESIFNL